MGEKRLRLIEMRDLIAILMVICGTYMKLSGVDGVVSLMLVAVAFWYFGGKGKSGVFSECLKSK